MLYTIILIIAANDIGGGFRETRTIRSEWRGPLLVLLWPGGMLALDGFNCLRACKLAALQRPNVITHAQQSIRSNRSTTDPLVDCHKLRARLACDRAWNELPGRQGPDGLL